MQAVEKLTVLVARREGIKLELRGEGKVSQLQEAFLAADASLVYEASDLFEATGVNVTPLFRLHKIKGFLRSELLPLAGSLPVEEDRVGLELADNEDMWA
jgi:hypothetical protein